VKEEKIRKIVREGYAKVAKQEAPCCVEPASCGCSTLTTEEISKRIGYSEEDLSSVPEGANLGLGCGNPTALASLKEGETVLDLGSGAGFDCFLAANRVGKNGKVIGVDMTPEMIDKARRNAAKGKYFNVEFRLGEIENLPAADNSVDAIISNCVINLSPDKRRVFREAFRVLKPSGRMIISDIVLLKELPDEIKNSIEAYVGCVAGASKKDEYLGYIKQAGFQDVNVLSETSFPIELVTNDPTASKITRTLKISTEKLKDLSSSIVSIKVHGTKPKEEN